jgi:hypothetical protein
MMQLINYSLRCNIQFTGNVLELVIKTFKGIKINKKIFLSRDLIYNKTFKFYHSYRYSIGLATNEEMRSFLQELLPVHIPIPNSERIPDFIQELLISILTFEVERLAYKAKDTFDNFISYYENKKLEDITMLKDHPFTHGLYNSISNAKKILNEDLPNTTLIDLIVDMRLQTVDKLVEKYRDPSEKVMKLDKM